MTATGQTSPRTDRHTLLYDETQRFTQVWVWLLILGVAATAWYAAFRTLVLGESGNGADGRGGLIAWLLTGLALPLGFASMHLRTEVRLDGVYARFFPLHLRYRSWRFDEIESADPCTYSPLREYGGWGIRRGRKGWAYNVSGNQGVQLVLKTGKQILIGTQHPERLSGAIRSQLRSKS